jgi:hypothetical protein
LQNFKKYFFDSLKNSSALYPYFLLLVEGVILLIPKQIT